MQMGIFKSVVKDKITEIVDNIAEASERYADGEKEPIAEDSVLKTFPYKKQLEEFFHVANGKAGLWAMNLKIVH
jgi:hypothetical protein